MKHILTLVICTLTFQNLAAQTVQKIDSLNKKIVLIEAHLKSLEDSLVLIKAEIEKTKAQELLSRFKDSSLTVVTKEGAKLKSTPNTLTDVIKTFAAGTTLKVVGKEGSYYQVCSDEICGYMNDLWFSKDPKMESLTNSNFGSVQKTSSNATPKRTSRTSTSKTKSSTSHSYITGPRGGCYYINSSGKKTYVDKSKCN